MMVSQSTTSQTFSANREPGDVLATNVADHGQHDGDIASIIDFPRLRASRFPAASLHPLQEWEGYVVEIGNTDFTARLFDLTADEGGEEEEAIIPFSEISDQDTERLREGSIFRWVIGYERTTTGTKRRVSQIVFRDLPVVTGSDVRHGEAWARDIRRALGL